MKTEGIFVGLSTIDIIYTVSQHPFPNQKIAAQSQQVLVGGPATNAAVTFAFLGGSTTLVTPVGLNPLTAVIRQEFKDFTIELIDLAPDSDDPSPLSSVWVDSEGQRTVISTNTAGRKIATAVVVPSLLSRASIVMVDGHAMQACIAWAEAARSAGITVVFDGGSWKQGTDQLLKHVDVAICSADFLPPSCETETDTISYLRAAGVHMVAITHGRAPIRYVSHSAAGLIEVPAVPAIDTTGAGDIFHGAFCFYYAAGQAFEESLAKAAAIASESCRYRGTRQWMKEYGSLRPATSD